MAKILDGIVKMKAILCELKLSYPLPDQSCLRGKLLKHKMLNMNFQIAFPSKFDIVFRLFNTIKQGFFCGFYRLT